MSSFPSKPQPPRQTTVLIGGSNGTKTLCSILGDKSNQANNNHTIRVVTRNTKQFLDPENNDTPIEWRCKEQKCLTDLLPYSLLPTTWTVHVGSPSSVFSYTDLENAISGQSGIDDGGIADVIILACPVYAHLDILRHIARALYKLNSSPLFKNRKSAAPLFIGTLYAAGGFDWMCRLAFSREKPPGFTNWKRPLALFGLKSFPYLCKSLQTGEVVLYGRYPQLTVAVCPSTPRVRAHARRVLERVLQSEATGKYLRFLGISGDEGDGGDGSGIVVDELAAAAVTSSSSSYKSHPKSNPNPGATTVSHIPGPLPPLPSRVSTRSMADLADAHSSLAFLSSTLNATNQILHPCIIAALFGSSDPSSPEDGSLRWEGDTLPRFYGDGAAIPEAGRLITAIAVGEMYPLMYTLDKILAPHGMFPVCAQHGGEPVGRWALNETGNSPRDLAVRSGLTEMVLEKEMSREMPENGTLEERWDVTQDVPERTNLIKYEGLFARLMSYGLSRNSRLGSVLSPAYKDEKTGLLKPKVDTRFFIDDIPHGLCITLGLAEMLGFDLERDMKETLGVVRRLQKWMGKEYVQPSGRRGGIVAGARDLGETSAPQAFGVMTIGHLKDFLSMCPFGDNVQERMEGSVNKSAMFEEEMMRAKL